MFQLGLAVIALALMSPIGYLSDVYIWVRALQELLVAVVGPGLIVLGAPWAAFRLAPRRLAWLLARPVLAVVAANVVWLGWQLPAPVRRGSRQRRHRAGRARQLRRGRDRCSGCS